jgi:predicted transcriptional regulator
MTKEQLIKFAGSQVELGKLLGISQPAVSAWKEVPQARIWQLKLLRPEWFEYIEKWKK